MLVGTFPTHFNSLTNLLLIQNFRASPSYSCVGLLSGMYSFTTQCFSVLPFPLNPQGCCQPPAPLLCWISHCILWAGFLTNSEMDKTFQMLGSCNENSTAVFSFVRHQLPFSMQGQSTGTGENHEITVKGSQHQLQYTAG